MIEGGSKGWIACHMPFLVNIKQLFERFVAAWLQAHHREVLELHGLQLQVQQRVHLSDEHAIHFDIDRVLVDIATGPIRYVLDTAGEIATEM